MVIRRGIEEINELIKGAGYEYLHWSIMVRRVNVIYLKSNMS
jgi:hypothetical protein